MLSSLQGLQDQLRGGGTTFFNADAAGRFQQVQQALTIPLSSRVSDRSFAAFGEQDSLFGGIQPQVNAVFVPPGEMCIGACHISRGKPLLVRCAQAQEHSVPNNYKGYIMHELRFRLPSRTPMRCCIVEFVARS